MTKDNRREIAVHLSYETVLNPMQDGRAAGQLFNQEYYDTFNDPKPTV
jgi:hypothetical protein